MLFIYWLLADRHASQKKTKVRCAEYFMYTRETLTHPN